MPLWALAFVLCNLPVSSGLRDSAMMAAQIKDLVLLDGQIDIG